MGIPVKTEQVSTDGSGITPVPFTSSDWSILKNFERLEQVQCGRSYVKVHGPAIKKSNIYFENLHFHSFRPSTLNSIKLIIYQKMLQLTRFELVPTTHNSDSLIGVPSPFSHDS